MAKSTETNWSQKGNKPRKLQIQSVFNTEIFDVLKTLRINKSRP